VFVWALALGGIGLVLGAASAQATTIILSTHSSDETDPAVLDATFDFSITGASELTLTITNDTPDYVISSVFFNGSTDVTSLTFDSATKDPSGSATNVTGRWIFSQAPPPIVADGFGGFDFNLEDKGNGSPATREILAGETVAFVFTITGTGPFDMDDFAAEFSTVPPGDTQSIAAAMFVRGPGDDSAFGSYVPEPSTFTMLALGLVGLTFVGRKVGSD
jgi:hypothetical protein